METNLFELLAYYLLANSRTWKILNISSSFYLAYLFYSFYFFSMRSQAFESHCRSFAFMTNVSSHKKDRPDLLFLFSLCSAHVQVRMLLTIWCEIFRNEQSNIYASVHFTFTRQIILRKIWKCFTLTQHANLHQETLHQWCSDTHQQ